MRSSLVQSEHQADAKYRVIGSISSYYNKMGGEPEAEAQTAYAESREPPSQSSL